MTVRRVMIYQCSDASPYPIEPFHLRAASALEVTRKEHYGEHGTFKTSDREMTVDQPFHNANPQAYPWDSPRYFQISSDDETASFEGMERTLMAASADFSVTMVRVGDGEYDIDAEKWITFNSK